MKGTALWMLGWAGDLLKARTARRRCSTRGFGRIRLLAFALLLLGKPLFPADFTVNLLLESALSLGAGMEDTFLYGFDQYANIRFQSKIRDRGTFYGSVNLMAASGNSALAASLLALASGGEALGFAPSAYAAGDNYAAAIELERLYIRLNYDYFDVDAGLMRLPFGYSLAWGPLDFLNPRNPLVPDARPRAILGGALFAYPLEAWKITAFGASPKNPLNHDGAGFTGGAAAETHQDRFSFQGLYAYEAPRDGADEGLHRLGFSAKGDLLLGWTSEALYTLDPAGDNDQEGLSASAGADYSFRDGDVYVLAEYLFNGLKSSTSAGLGGLSKNHYLYGMVRYAFNDYTNASAACIASLEDGSLTPILTGEYELFQGMILSLSLRFPLDFQDEPGALGPEKSGSRFMGTLKGTLRL